MAPFSVNTDTGTVELPPIRKMRDITEFPKWSRHLMLVLRALSLEQCLILDENHQGPHNSPQNRALVTLIIEGSVSPHLLPPVVGTMTDPKQMYGCFGYLYRARYGLRFGV
jgi:hypothetical protein